MNRFGFRFVAFILGVLVAVGLAYATRPPSGIAIARTERHLPLDQLNVSELPLPQVAAPSSISWNQVVEEKPSSKTQMAQVDRPALPEPIPVTTSHLDGIPPSARLSVIVQAVHDGSGSSLRNLDSRSLSLLPEYRVSILPALKRESLSALLSRFRAVDWTNWQLSSFARNGGPTLARSYVDTVQAVNPELGRYLETAAPLFQKLSLETNQGRIFSPERALASIMEAAEQRPSTVANRAYDANILDEPGFRIFLEQLRARLVARFLDTHDVEPLLAFQLICSTHPSAGGGDLGPRMKLLLQKFTLDASPMYRETVFAALNSTHYVEEISQDQPTVRRALAELYVVASLDAADVNDRKRAAVYLDESLSIYPGLRSQELITQLLKRESFASAPETMAADGQKSLDVKKSGAKQSAAKQGAAHENPLFGDSAEHEESDSSLAQGISYLSAVIFFLVIGGALFFVFVYWRSVRTLRMTTDDIAPKHSSPPSSVRITPPGEMNFDDDILSDIGHSRAANA